MFIITLEIVRFMIIDRINAETLTVINNIYNMNVLVIKSRNIKFLSIPVRKS